MSIFRKLIENDPSRGIFSLDKSKYPARMGKKWDDDEILKLLTSIQQKKTITLIAMEHERTTGAINAERCKLAADYWFNDGRPIEQISRFTGLTKAEIENIIDKKASSKKYRDAEQETIDRSEVQELISLLKEVKDRLAALYEQNEKDKKCN